jgi:hypothetical protein
METGNIDMPFGMDYQGISTSQNVEDSLSSVFREIGTTLKDVTLQGISTTGDTVKTLLAQKIMDSPEGQAQIAAYKASYLVKYLPWLALIVVGLFVAGRFTVNR